MGERQKQKCCTAHCNGRSPRMRLHAGRFGPGGSRRTVGDEVSAPGVLQVGGELVKGAALLGVVLGHKACRQGGERAGGGGRVRKGVRYHVVALASKPPVAAPNLKLQRREGKEE